MDVLSVRDLRKGFVMHTIDGRHVEALRGVSLDVGEGEHVALAGTSGAGKSTLLRCVYRTYLPSGGQVLLHRPGRPAVDLVSLPDQQVADLRGREIGYVSQFLRAEPRRPVVDLVARAGVARGMSRSEAHEAAVDVLRHVGIEEKLWAMHASVLSGGQKQRVNLAAGTISPPRILLLDEPVSALDPHNRESVLELVAGLTDRGVGVLSVFHDMEAIERLATRVVVLADGRTVADGHPTEVLSRAGGRSMNRTILAHATAVLPGRVLEDALVVAEDGVITHVDQARPGSVPAEAVDARGALLMPGLIDTHSDGLEKELRPRPGAEFDTDFAITGFEGRVRAAGVTTLYHGIGFETSYRKGRTVEQARGVTRALHRRRRSGHAVVDHRLLLRVDARDPESLGAVRELLDAEPAGSCPLVSYEDHTPGQGQYREPEYFRRYLQETQELTEEQARAHMAELVADRNSREWHRPVALEWLGRVAAEGRAVLLAHDPEDREQIDNVHTHGARVAEFPTAVEAAEAARERGMSIVAGGPNVLRGGSHSGNVSAAELIERRLVDALSSDYLPTSLLAAVFLITRQRLAPLSEAVRLVTAGPADMVGLSDRGRLQVGARADLVLATLDGDWPTARWTHRADDLAAADLPAFGDVAALAVIDA